MANEIIVIQIRKVILDVILLNCIGWPILFLFLWGSAYQRGFFCNDTNLIHPYHESTVPSWTLYITGIGLNCAVVSIKDIFLLYSKYHFMTNYSCSVINY
nr:unnamed protein product [Callosobruchus chinensis]